MRLHRDDILNPKSIGAILGNPVIIQKLLIQKTLRMEVSEDMKCVKEIKVDH